MYRCVFSAQIEPNSTKQIRQCFIVQKKAYRTSDHRASKGKEMKNVSFAKSVP